jgi:hypothetical protein
MVLFENTFRAHSLRLYTQQALSLGYWWREAWGIAPFEPEVREARDSGSPGD